MEEFARANMGDAYLSRRLIKLADRLGDAPSASIPGACNGRTETQAAYRLFDQAREDKRGVGWEDVLAPHLARTETRMAVHPVVLCLQDTTELDFNGEDMDGLGRLSYEAQRGLNVRPTCPDLPAQTEWQAVWLLAEKPAPRKTPTLRGCGWIRRIEYCRGD